MSEIVDDSTRLAKSNQEQAVAAWVGYLNQLRLEELVSAYKQRNLNLAEALATIEVTVKDIGSKVVETNRGGVKGMHGFIAEIAEVGVGNARSRILGGGAVYRWVNDNGPVDLMRGEVEIQQKFVAAGGRFGLGAIAEHLGRYPDFVRDGGKYQIPGDHFRVVRELHAMSPEDAGRLLTRGGDGPSFGDWQRVRAFFAEGQIGVESIEPSALDYHDVQRDSYEATLRAEQDSLRATDKSLRDSDYQASLLSMREGVKATLASAAIEGGTAIVLAIVQKRREGMKFEDFTREDWTGIGLGFVQGGVRGMSTYTLTNFTATPAAVASSIVTASFGIAAQANKFRRGEIDELEFIENAELVSLEAAVSALSSFLGQAAIPVPILGAVIGNTVGTVMYRAVSSALSQREAEAIARYLDQQRLLTEQLAAEHRELIDRLEASMADYLGLLDRAFTPDVEAALTGSAELARQLGVAADEILDSDEKTLAFFLD
ncbi:hypothetical protein [Nocardia sp. NPDC057668]|uniref:hypothetical protein n=1 Tax=Nocardia sp. NPDC057668 TaxID=3346202 RepID=UPI00366B3D86